MSRFLFLFSRTKLVGGDLVLNAFFFFFASLTGRASQMLKRFVICRSVAFYLLFFNRRAKARWKCIY